MSPMISVRVEVYIYICISYVYEYSSKNLVIAPYLLSSNIHYCFDVATGHLGQFRQAFFPSNIEVVIILQIKTFVHVVH
jgi:hypothetical protein